MNIRHTKKGFISLFAIIMIGSIAFLFAVSLLLQGVGAAQNVLLRERAHLTKAYATACGELALQTLASDQNYTGSGNVTFSEGICTYVVSGSSTKVVNVTAEVSQTIRKLTLTVNEYGVTWKEDR